MGIINKLFGVSGGNTYDGQGEERSGGIDIIQYNGVNSEYVWKFPYNNIITGARLIVNQSQEAIFVSGGQIADVFGPGSHTLSTGNLPILSRLINIPFGNKTPFIAEVWYIDKRPHRQMPFGTPSPLLVLDPYFGSTLPIKANGEFGLRITDTTMFYTEVVGTQHLTDEREINKMFKAHIQRKLNKALTDFVNKGIRSTQMMSYLDEISEYVKNSLSEEVESYGLSVVNFDLAEIVLDRNDPQAIAALEREKGFADTEMESTAMARKRAREGYTYQQERQFDVMETAAGNEGSAGQMMGAGMGIGMGFGIGGAMGTQFGNMAQGVANAHPVNGQPMVQSPVGQSTMPQQMSGAPVPPPPPPTSLYHVLINNVQQGPYSIPQLQQLVQQGVFSAQTYVWKQGMSGWQTASECAELAGLFVATPPPPPAM